MSDEREQALKTVHQLSTRVPGLVDLLEQQVRIVGRLFRGGRQVQRLFELTGVGSRLEFVSAEDADGLAPTPSN